MGIILTKIIFNGYGGTGFVYISPTECTVHNMRIFELGVPVYSSLRTSNNHHD